MPRRRQPAKPLDLFDEHDPSLPGEDDNDEEPLSSSSYVISSETGGTSEAGGGAMTDGATAPEAEREADQTPDEDVDELDGGTVVAGAVGSLTGAPFQQWVDILNR